MNINALAIIAGIIAVIGILFAATETSHFIAFVLLTIASLLWAYYSMETDQVPFFYIHLLFAATYIVGSVTQFQG